MDVLNVDIQDLVRVSMTMTSTGTILMRRVISPILQLKYRPIALCASRHQYACTRSLSTHAAEDKIKDHTSREIEALQARNVDRSLLRELSFEDYITLKKRLTIRSYLFGIPCFGVGILGSAYSCATLIPNMIPENADEVVPIFGVDPLLFATLATTTSGIASFLIGTTLFRVLWRTFFRHHAAMLDARETDFRLRIARHRRGGHDFSHDYYGDKIKTLADYRAINFSSTSQNQYPESHLLYSYAV
eukprot:gene8569-1008_t